MKIMGFSIKKISAEAKSQPKGKLEVKQGININNIAKEEVPISDKPALKFDFTFSIDYAPGIAKIEMLGSIITLDDKDESKEILKEWKKKKFSDAGIKVPLFNFIMSKCNIKALQLEEELGLPFHIPMPRVAPSQESNQQNNNPANYAG